MEKSKAVAVWRRRATRHSRRMYRADDDDDLENVVMVMLKMMMNGMSSTCFFFVNRSKNISCGRQLTGTHLIFEGQSCQWPENRKGCKFVPQ